MKKILLVLSIFLSFGISAQQLTLTQAANEPAIGDVDSQFNLDTSYYSSGLHASVTGTNVVWDFTHLQATNPPFISHYYSPSTFTGSAGYPGCTVVQDDGFAQTFLKSTTTPTTQTEILGIISNTLSLTFTNSAVAAKYPVSLGNSSTDNISGNFSGFGLTGTCAGSIVTKADGTGTLMLPNGVTLTNVLRVKSVQSLVFTNFIPLATGKQTIYNFYHSSQKFAVLSFNYTSIAITASSPTVTGSASGSTNHFVAVGVKENMLDAGSLSVYPNPFTSVITLGIQEKFHPKEIRIFSQLGQLVYQGNYSKTVNLNDLPAGIYFMEVKTDQGTARKKLIRE